MKLQEIKNLKIKITYEDGSYDEVDYNNHTFEEISIHNEIGSEASDCAFMSKNAPTGRQRLTFVMIDEAVREKFML